MNKTQLLFALSAVGFGLFVAGCGPQGAGPARSSPEGTRILRDKPAPDFSLTTLDGKTVRLSELKGQVVLLDFWATWCPPCLKSLPHLQKIHEDTALRDKGLRVFAINAREPKATVQRFVDDNKYTFAVPLDADGAVMSSYHVEGIPTTVIVGRQGTVESVFVGFGSGSEQQLDSAIQAALQGG